MPALGLKAPPVLENSIPGAVKLTMLDPQSRVPLVVVQIPLKVWFKLVPRFNVPPVPFIVRPPAFIGPVMVAVPAVLVIDTVPVVVKPAML